MGPTYLQTDPVMKEGKLIRNLFQEGNPDGMPKVDEKSVLVGSLFWNYQLSSLVLDSNSTYRGFIETLAGCSPPGIGHLYSFPKNLINESVDNSGRSDEIFDNKFSRDFRSARPS